MRAGQTNGVPSGVGGITGHERHVEAAEEADDPPLVAAAKWHLGGQLLHDGHLDGAEEVVQTTIDGLSRQLLDRDRAVLAMFGQLHLLASIISARKGLVHHARRHVELAAPVADATGETNVHWTVWGPLNVRLHAVAVEAECGRPHDGLRATRAIDTRAFPGLPSVDRRARHFMHVAWLYDQIDEPAGVAVHLRRAEQEGPEEVRYNVLARRMVAGLLRRAPTGHGRDVLGLAQRLGMLT